MIIQTEVIGQMLTEAGKLLSTLQGVDVSPADHGNPQGAQHRAARAKQAEAVRKLLYLQHVLNTAATLVGVEYWAARGYDNGLMAYIDEEPEVASS